MDQVTTWRLVQTTCCEVQESLAAPRRIETNVDELWAEEPQQDPEPASSLSPVLSGVDAMGLAQHACANIEHKAFVGTFVPHNRLLTILQGLKLFPGGALRGNKHTIAKLTNKRRRDKCPCAHNFLTSMVSTWTFRESQRQL